MIKLLANGLRMFCKLIFRVEVHGLTNVPAENRLLIVANHESLLDGLLLGLFLPKHATFVVHTDVLKSWFFRQILTLTPHIAIDPSNPLAIKQIIKKLQAGENVVIFPEGHITSTGALMKVYDGPGFIAAKTGAKILPVCIQGAAQSFFGRLPASHPKKLLPKVTLSIQPITHIRIAQDKEIFIHAKQRRKMAGEKMRKLMQNLLFETRIEKTFFATFLDTKTLFGANTKAFEDPNGVEDSYQDVLKKSLALGRIVNKVSAPQENVGVLMPNVTTTIALVLGMSAFARVPAMLNYTAGAQGMLNACKTANIKTIISSKLFIEKANLKTVIDQLNNDTSINILYLEDLRKHFSPLDKLWLMGFAMRCPSLACARVNPNDNAVILFTSGSEGKPKGVVHTHNSILSNIAQIKAILDFTPTDKFMMVLPFFHAFGFTGTLLPLFSGIKTLVFPSPLLYKVIPEVIYDKGCTVLFATSSFLGQYAKFAHPYDFHRLRHVIAGAEKLNATVRETYQDKFGIRILEGYGATECAPVLSANTPMACLNGSVGQLVPGLEHKLLPVAGIENGGQLLVKGKNVMKGYFLHDKPATLVPPNDGWYDTGDVVEIDAEGFVHIKGRVKRFAKVAGEMVSLEVVETIANIASPEAEHAASTQTDIKRGENIILFTTDVNLKRDALQQASKQLGSPEIAIARKIILLDAIPVLGTGKTDYVALKKMAEQAS